MEIVTFDIQFWRHLCTLFTLLCLLTGANYDWSRVAYAGYGR